MCVLSDPILGRNHKEYNQGCGLQKIANPLWLRKELFNLYLLTVTVDKGSPDAEHASKEVTVVISRKVKPGYEKEYDEWLRRYLILGKKVPGYVGATIITQGGTNSAIRHIIYRFSDKASLDAWENSEEARKQIEEANKSSTRYYERATGLETWFNVPDFKAVVAPPKWKMAIATFIVANTINSLSRYILNPFLAQWPLLASTTVYTIILVVLLTYLGMPTVSRLLRRWLYPRNV
jgi:antibiotic biosynthesis monooxygenase (ABM) superfamily enzyme